MKFENYIDISEKNNNRVFNEAESWVTQSYAKDDYRTKIIDAYKKAKEETLKAEEEVLKVKEKENAAREVVNAFVARADTVDLIVYEARKNGYIEDWLKIELQTWNEHDVIFKYKRFPKYDSEEMIESLEKHNWKKVTSGGKVIYSNTFKNVKVDFWDIDKNNPTMKIYM